MNHVDSLVCRDPVRPDGQNTAGRKQIYIVVFKQILNVVGDYSSFWSLHKTVKLPMFLTTQVMAALCPSATTRGVVRLSTKLGPETYSRRQYHMLLDTTTK